MKKLLLSMQLLFLSILMLQAQTIVTIGNGTTGANYLPVATYYKYSFSEQIILADEYTAAGGVTGYISSIGFQYIYGVEQTKDPVSIYIGTTSDTTFSTTQFIPTTNMTLVYEGPITFNNSGTNYWVTIPFNESYFYYGGTGNLVIAVKNNTGVYTTGSNNTFYTHVAGANKSLRYTNDGSPWAPQSNGTQGETRNNMRFEIVPQQMSCFSPTELSANNITSNSGDLTWTPRGSETSWEIEYRLATASEWTISGTSTNNFYTLNDLLAATDYQVRIRAVCGSEDLSTWKTISFTTLCETISTFPFYTGIDNANGSGAAYFPYCWLRKTTNSTQYPYVNKDQYSTYPYSLYFLSNKTSYSIAATPALAPDVIVEDLSVVFKAMKSSNDNGILEVGLMSNPADETTFTVVQTFNTGNYTASKTWYEFEVPLNCDTCIGRHIAFRAPKLSSTSSLSNYVFIDDIAITSNCSRPTHVVASNITGTTADVTFDGGTNSSFQYICLPFTVAPYLASADDLHGCSTSFTVDNLFPNTKYDLYVRSECPSGYSAWSKVCTFSTECTAISELPYTNNFENQGSYTMNNKSYPTCWTRITSDASTTTYYPYIHTTNSSSAPTALYFSSSNSNYYGMALPPLDASIPANTVQLKFKALITSATYGYFQIGVMTNPADINTFTLVKELSPSNFPNTNMWYNITVPFNNYQGEGLYIAVISPKEKGSLSLYMDDVVLEALSTCIITNPSDAYDVTFNSATINWEPNGSATQVEIKYGHYGFMMDTATAVVTTDTFYNFLNLDPNTQYSYYVRTVCGAEETEWSTRKDFRTECSLVETLPYFEGFEGESNSDFIFCWKRLNPGNTSVSYPKIATYKKRTGAYSMQFNTVSDKSSVAISPKLAENIDIANLQISFYANTNSLPGILEVGVMSDPDDISTFTIINTMDANNYSAASTWCYMESSFIGYEGDARYIAIRASESATNNDIYVDDVTIDLLPICPRISPSIRDISSNQITVKIPNNGSAQSFDVVVADTLTSHPDTCSSLVTVSEDSIAVTGLQPNTHYYLYVRGNCENETSSEWSFPLSFYTNCSGLEAIDLPWKENFDVNWTTGYYNTVSLWSINEQVNATFRDNCMNRIGASYMQPGGSPSYIPSYYTYPAIYGTSSALTGPNALYLSNSSSIGYQPTYISTPRISENVDIHTLKFTCQVRRDYLPYGNFDVGVMENPADSSTYTVVRSFSPSSFTSTKTYEKFSVPMETYEGTGRYITVRMRGDGSTYETMYMDNFMIEVEDACAAPLGVQADTITEYTATLSWEPRLNHESYEVLITTEAVNPDTVIAPFYTSNTSLIEIANLEAGSRYYAYVRAYCQNESNPSRWTEQPYIFFTKCLPVAIPLFENFDIWGTGEPARPLPPCWSRINNNTSNPNPYIDDTYPYSGPGCIYLFASSTSDSYLVSPELDVDDWSNVKVSFKARINSNTNTYGKLTVGISTNPSDTTTYTVLHTINHADYTVTGTSTAAWIDFEFPLTGYTGEGHYLVIGSSAISNLVYIDNFAVEVLPDCQRPYNVIFSSIDASSAVVSWDNNNAGNYQVIYGPKGFNIANGTPLDVNAGDTSYLITGLNSNTFYDVYVRSHCGETYGDWSFTRTFRTGCTAITTVPFTENFDNEPIGSSVDVEAIPCWNRHYPGSTSTIYPYVNSNSTAPTAPNVLYFSTSSSYYSYVTLPLIDTTVLDLSDLQLSFKLRKTSANYKLEVGVMTDPHNFGTYQVINSNLSPAATNTWEDFTVNFSTYTGNGAYITLLAPAGSTIYLDDILLENRTFCDAPTNFTASNTTLTSATLNWTENENATEWQVAYGPQGFIVNESATVVVNTNPYTLSGLQPHTIYDCYVRSVCSVEGYSSWVKTTFYTIDNIPNTSDVHFETFEDYITGNSVASEAQALGRTFWNTWNFTPGNASDALVSNEQASTGNKSLKVLAGNDNVLLLTDTNTGIHTIEWDIFVPAGKKAYHSVMQEFIDGDHVTRGVEIYFSEGTVGHIKTAGNIQVEFNYTPNTWIHNAMIIDLDQDVAVFTTGGHVVHTWQWSNTGIKRLRGMNIFGENQASTLYYIDNIDYVSSLDSTRILLASADANGSISPVGAQIVPVGSTQSFTMTPNANCVINDVLVDGSSVLNQLVGNVYSFTNVMANHSIHATFRDTSTVIVEYTITASAGMGGTITPSGDVVVTAGTSKTFTMTAQPGYEIQQVLVDGNNEGLLNSYTFNNILANHLIHVDFNNVGIEDVSIANQVQLSPNPADNFIYIGVSDQLTVKEAGIYDVYGKLVKDLSIKDKNTEINVSALSSGIYFVRLSCDEGFIAKKFVKK